MNECKDKISYDRKTDPFRLELLTQDRKLKFLQTDQSIDLITSDIIGVAMRREREFSESQSYTQENKNLYIRWDKEREDFLLLELYRFQINRIEMSEIYQGLVEKIVRLETKVDW